MHERMIRLVEPAHVKIIMTYHIGDNMDPGEQASIYSLVTSLSDHIAYLTLRMFRPKTRHPAPLVCECPCEVQTLPLSHVDAHLLWLTHTPTQ